MKKPTRNNTINLRIMQGDKKKITVENIVGVYGRCGQLWVVSWGDQPLPEYADRYIGGRARKSAKQAVLPIITPVRLPSALPPSHATDLRQHYFL